MIKLNIEVPESFLQEETLCGYKVSKQMKEIWAVEMDLMMELDRVCKKHNLTYFAAAGTMLGAVRHQGFIPWDDDMDFYMLRDDYDKLMGLADEFKDPYFLQNAYTDQANMRKHARVRNIHTTACSVWEKNLPGNKGIFIDIFPLDGVNENVFLNTVQKIQAYYYKMLIKEKMSVTERRSFKIGAKRFLRNTLITLTNRDKVKSFMKYDECLKRYSVANTKIWGDRIIYFDCPLTKQPIEIWHDIVTVPFEFLQIPIPRNYDTVLKQQYGNYMEFPKNKNSGKLHQTEIFSTDYSFEELMNRK